MWSHWQATGRCQSLVDARDANADHPEDDRDVYATEIGCRLGEEVKVILPFPLGLVQRTPCLAPLARFLGLVPAWWAQQIPGRDLNANSHQASMCSDQSILKGCNTLPVGEKFHLHTSCHTRLLFA